MPQVYTVATKNTYADFNDTDSEDLILSKPADDIVEAPAAQSSRNEPAANEGKRQSQRRTNQNSNFNGQGVSDASKPSQRRPRNNGTQGSANSQNVEGGEQARRGPRRTAPAPTHEDGAEALKQQPRPIRRRPAERRSENAEHMGMDKLSGTGRGREMKKEGGGGHNWGNETADFGGAEEANESDEKRKARSDDEQGKETANGAKSQPEVLSYDKYKAEISEKIRVAEDSNEVDDEAEKQKYVQQGYEIYTKAARGSSQSQKKSDNDDENSSRPKPMHLAELAAQSGVELRYGGSRRPKRENREEGASRRNENESTKEDRKEYHNKSSQQQQRQQQSQRHEINLADKLAFPTLEAH